VHSLGRAAFSGNESVARLTRFPARGRMPCAGHAPQVPCTCPRRRPRS